MNIVQPFLNRARSHPQLSALSCHGQTLTYGQLALRSHALASGMLQNLSLKRAQRVMVCIENRAAFFETLFACWIAGLCPVPVNAKLHPKEVRQIAGDCQASVLFCSAALHQGLQTVLLDMPQAPQLLCVDDDAYAGLLRHAPTDCVPMQADDIAWIFYTSGTTGVSGG